MRPSRRQVDELRAVSLERSVVKYAEGSCFVKFGDTHVLVTASLEERLPPWLKGQGRGWVTAEYGMLPRATAERTRREASAGKQGGRTVEIQRLIGRSLRSVIDLQALGERQITIDCDVIQADGGTRTASITGAWVALSDCLTWMKTRDMFKGQSSEQVLRDHIAAENLARALVERRQAHLVRADRNVVGSHGLTPYIQPTMAIAAVLFKPGLWLWCAPATHKDQARCGRAADKSTNCAPSRSNAAW